MVNRFRLSWLSYFVILLFTIFLWIPQHANAAIGDIDLSAMDKSVSPSADFYHFANGKWLEKTQIPADQPDWDSFGILYERNQDILRKLVEKAAADQTAAPKSPEGEVGSFYRSATDEKRIQADGYTPIQPELSRIDSITDQASLITEIGHLHRLNVGTAFSFGGEQDPGNSSAEIASVGQGGLGLPEPGYYTRTDSASVAIRTAYVALITQDFISIGETPASAAADAATVLSIETKLAAVSKTPDELRDPVANYHKMPFAKLEALTPTIDWQTYFDTIELPNPGPIDVSQPEFFVGIASLLTSVPMSDWKTYLKWDLIDGESPRLSDTFDVPYFNFFGKLLNGTPVEQVRWKRAIQATDGEIGFALGQLYVAQNFPPAAKARALKLVLNLKATLRHDITVLPWMGSATKKSALTKIDAMAIKIGYPDHWRDYSSIDLTSPSYAINCLRADELAFQHNLNEIGKPVDRTEWGMTPPTVNAYYDDSTNSINFPAGILQPPFFDPSRDDATNYGSIGAVIGHEMTHGFDDSGRQFDYLGDLHNWWTASDLKNFNIRKQGIIDQYSTYEALPGHFINGKLTIGENIADIGGCKIAFLALQASLKGKPTKLIDGYTPQQRYFIAFAQMWRDKRRPAYDLELLQTDPHSPDRFRVKGVLADTPEFSKAFPGNQGGAGSATTIW